MALDGCAQIDDNGGAHYQFVTGPTLAVPPPDTAYGQVFLHDGVTPAAETIVYIELEDADGQGSGGRSAQLSALVDVSGHWAISLSAARIQDYSASFQYSRTGDLVRLFAQSASLGSAAAETKTAHDAPAPPMTLKLPEPTRTPTHTPTRTPTLSKSQPIHRRLRPPRLRPQHPT